MYHIREASLNLLDMSLHLKDSETPMISILVLMALMCSYRWLFPSKAIKDEGLKF